MSFHASCAPQRSVLTHPQRPAPQFPTNTRLSAPLGRATVQAISWGARANCYLYEVAYDNRSGVFTYREDELGALLITLASLSRWCVGETVHTPDGEAVIRNLFGAPGKQHALVQDIGTNTQRTVPVADLTPPLEAA